MTAETAELQALADVVQARKDFLGNTTEQAVDATAVNVCVSLRADTATAKKNAFILDGRYYVEIEPTGFVAGWAHPAGKHSKKGRRVIRTAGGHAIERVGGCRVVNLAGNYKSSKSATVFSLAVYNRESASEKPFYPAKTDAVYCIANSVQDVQKFAELRIRRRIGQYRGVSKRALGVAAHAIAARGGGTSLSGDLERLVDNFVDVEKLGGGFDSGNYSVSVMDNFPHAEQALKRGSSSQAIQKVVNKTLGIVNKTMEKSSRFWERLESPFVEFASRRHRTFSGGLYLPARDTFVRMSV